jgi:hypothetical protein
MERADIEPRRRAADSDEVAQDPVASRDGGEPANFPRMAQSQPQLVTRLTQLLAERIWMSYRQLANTIMANPLGRLYDRLWLELEKNRVQPSPGTPHTFDFGPKDLINMVGMSMDEGSAVLTKLFENEKIKAADNRIVTSDNEEIRKQAAYYKKMERSRSPGWKAPCAPACSPSMGKTRDESPVRCAP